MFPLERRFRLGLADYHSEVRWKGSTLAAIVAIEQALAGDPHNAGLRRNLIGLLLEAGNEDAAHAQAQLVKKITPKSQIVVRVGITAD